MEMMEGGELFHRISQHRHFTEKMASQVTKQVGAAYQKLQLIRSQHIVLYFKLSDFVILCSKYCQ